MEAAHAAGIESTWAPLLETNADGRIVKEAWYFNGAFPWLGMAICAPVIGLWYWCTDQYIVQRALGAPNERVARQAASSPPSEAASGVPLPHPGLICFALARA